MICPFWSTALIGHLLAGTRQTTSMPRICLDAGVRKVAALAPLTNKGILNLVNDANHDLCDPHARCIVAAAHCPTSGLAPNFQALHEEMEIMCDCITTIHDPT